MRFLTGLVLALPAERSDKDLQKVQSTSAWIYDRISNLPAAAPAPQQQHRGSEGLLSPSTAGATASARRDVSGSGTPRRPSRHVSPSDPYDQHPGNSEGLRQSHSPQQAQTPALPAGPSSEDIMYQAVREAALIYSRAIMNRKSLRDPSICSQEDFLRVWTMVWRVPLRCWKGVLGVFVWVALSITPASRGTPHERFVKSILTAGLVQMAQEDWEVAEKGMRGALTLTAWLAGDGGWATRKRERRSPEEDGKGWVNLGAAAVDPTLFPSNCDNSGLSGW